MWSQMEVIRTKIKKHTSHFVRFGPRNSPNSPNSLWPFGPTQKKQPTPNPDHCFHGRACCRCSKLWEVVVWVALLPWAHRVRRAPRQQLPPPHRVRPVHRAPHLGRHPPCRDYPERVELGRGAKGSKWSTVFFVRWKEFNEYGSYNDL